MKTARQDQDIEFLSQLKVDLQHLLSQETVATRRPCPDCTIPCSCSSSAACPCDCSIECDEAPKKLSSDPEDFPIEAGILPLVYGLATLHLLPTNWSCEGHPAKGGMAPKLPRVWFYSSSLVYPHLIQEYLSDLYRQKRLTHPWVICLLSPESHEIEAVYSIEPKLHVDSEFDLPSYRRDIRVMSNSMDTEIRSRSQKHLQAVQARLAKEL